MKLYDFKVLNNKDENISLEKYHDKVVLIVNTATKCALTNQYKELEELYQKYVADGFEILDFPCNQFFMQSPLNDDEIDKFCKLNYQTSFDRFKKIDVNGTNTSLLYDWLKTQKPKDINDEISIKFEKSIKLFTLANKASDIKWNFTKFVIDKNGKVVARFSPSYPITKIEEEIKKLL